MYFDFTLYNNNNLFLINDNISTYIVFLKELSLFHINIRCDK
jgi:hypothetical protein